MIASTLLAIAGAGIGGYSGILTNEERRRRAQEQLDQLNASDRMNLKAEMAYAKILKGDISLAALQASSQSESDAEAVGKLKGTLEAQAGASGLRGGSPFFMLSSQVAKATRTLAMAETSRAMQLEGQELRGAAQIDQFRLKSQEIALETADVSHAANYYNSLGAMALSFGTGVMSGIATANQASTILEAMGVDMSADPVAALAAKLKAKNEMAGQGGGAGDASADISSVAGGPVTPETMGTLAVREDTVAPHEMTALDVSVINSVAAMRWRDMPDLSGSVYATEQVGGKPRQIGQTLSPSDSMYPYFAPRGGGSGVVDLFAEKMNLDQGLAIASPELSSFEGLKYPKPSGVALFGNNNLFDIQ